MASAYQRRDRDRCTSPVLGVSLFPGEASFLRRATGSSDDIRSSNALLSSSFFDGAAWFRGSGAVESNGGSSSVHSKRSRAVRSAVAAESRPFVKAGRAARVFSQWLRTDHNGALRFSGVVLSL
nr:hypothetical protein Iba_chr13dCG6400 [Ipomoea batatas]